MKYTFKKHYEENGLRLPEDFTEDEKKSIIEDNCVNLIGPKRLSQKYKTSIFAIRKFVWQEKAKITQLLDYIVKYAD